VKVADGFSVLVSEFEGKMYAYGSKCPHYGAPLVRGALMDGMVRCPWHGACFDIRTGQDSIFLNNSLDFPKTHPA